jgi:protein-disulfide isomerase
VRPGSVSRSVIRSCVVFLLAITASGASSQTVVGQGPRNPATPVKDSAMLKPPPGAKVAIIEWSDLECPYCAMAFPIVHAAMKQYGITLVQYDFLIPGHAWSAQAALFARYLQDKVSPALATDYRRQVFASQSRIANPEDLNNFTKQFMAAHGKPMPSVVDPTGQLKKQIDADCALGLKMGLIHTPTIFVVTQEHWIDVADVMQLNSAIDKAESEVAHENAPAGHNRAGPK